MRNEALNKAITAAGGVGRLAAKLGIKSPSISGWLKVPATRVLEIERATGVSRHDLRPDLYPRERRRQTRAA